MSAVTEAEQSSLAERLFDGLVGRRTGIVRGVAWAEVEADDAPLHHAAAQIADPVHARKWAGGKFAAASGSGSTSDAALTAALCEAAERDSAASFAREFTLRTADALGVASADRYAQFSEQQRGGPGFPFPRLDASTPLRWVRSERLATGEDDWDPAFAVYAPYPLDDSEPPAAPNLSTGLACSTDRDDAILRGLCEVVERDALALTWLGARTPRRIDDDWMRRESGDCLPPHDDVCGFDLTSDVGVPVALVVACASPSHERPGRSRESNPRRHNLWSVGSSCHVDPQRAIRKAALECSQDRIYVRHLLSDEPDWSPGDANQHVVDFSCHARLYSVETDRAASAFEFLLAADAASGHRLTACRRVNDPPSMIRQLVRLGHDPRWVDLKSEWAGRLGLHIGKALVPSLMPLHGHHALPLLGHSRLAGVDRALPHARPFGGDGLWPHPHPFP